MQGCLSARCRRAGPRHSSVSTDSSSTAGCHSLHCLLPGLLLKVFWATLGCLIRTIANSPADRLWVPLDPVHEEASQAGSFQSLDTQACFVCRTGPVSIKQPRNPVIAFLSPPAIYQAIVAAGAEKARYGSYLPLAGAQAKHSYRVCINLGVFNVSLLRLQAALVEDAVAGCARRRLSQLWRCEQQAFLRFRRHWVSSLLRARWKRGQT